jgi:YVTN family beta-propeller protein
MTEAAMPFQRPLLVLALLLAAGAVQAADLLVGNKSGDTVWRLSLRDGAKVGEFRAGPAPHEIAVASHGRFALVSNYGHQTSGNTLSVLDLVGGKPTRRIDLGEHSAPHGLRVVPGDRQALVTTEGSASLLLVDIEQGSVDKVFPIGPGIGHMVALSPDARHAYVSKIAAGTVSRIDLQGAEKALERKAGKGAEGIAVRPDGAEVWVTNREDGTVTVHDPKTLALKRRMTSKGFPIRVVFTPDGRHALVTNASAANLTVFDTRTKLQVARVELSQNDAQYRDTMLGRAALPIGVIVHPRQPRAFAAISGGDRIAVIDTRDWKVVDHWPTGREPDALGIVETP